MYTRIETLRLLFTVVGSPGSAEYYLQQADGYVKQLDPGKEAGRMLQTRTDLMLKQVHDHQAALQAKG